MEAFRRLLPFVWPHRRKLGWSIICGLIVAALWGSNLTVAYPVMVLQEATPREHLARIIQSCDAEIADLASDRAELDRQLEALEAEHVEDDDPRIVKLKTRRLDKDAKRHAANQKRYWTEWVQRTLLPWTPEDRFSCFALLIGLLVAATAVKGVFVYLQDVLVGHVAERAVMGVRKRLLRKLLQLDFQTLSAEGAGGLMARFTYDTEQLGSGVTLLGGKLIREPLKCLACAGLALWLNWRLTLFTLLFIPILAVVFLRFGKLLKRASSRMMESMSRIYRVLEETFDGLKVVIAFDGARRHRNQFHQEYERYFQKAMKLVQIDAIAKPVLEVLGLVALCAGMLPGAYLVLSGETAIFGVKLASEPLAIESLFTLYALLAGMLDPCRKMSTTFSRLKKSSAAVDRVFAMIDAVSRVQNPPSPAPLPRHSQVIEFRDVCFQYHARQGHETRGPVLDHISVTIPAGEVLAVVGHNGCGKSTLVSLLPRFFDPTSGEVYIDGQSLREVRLSDLRGQIGVVTQDTVLFDDTIAENIRYGRPEATREEIERAAKMARLEPLLAALPRGLDSPVGEKGRALSGGQRQRIALARAFLREPSILILDEATSAVDAESEVLIHEALKAFAPGRTVLLISHSLPPSLLDLVTRIVVLEEGRVLAMGTHSELLATCSVYSRLYQAMARRPTGPHAGAPPGAAASSPQGSGAAAAAVAGETATGRAAA